MIARLLLLWCAAQLAICGVEGMQYVTWNGCPCYKYEGFSQKCTRTIPRGAANNAKIDLMLHNCQITSITSEDLKFPNINWLNLKNNYIQQIDVHLFKHLTNVTYISLENNKLRGDSIHPDTFKYCKRLRGIGLSFNDMRNAPGDLLSKVGTLSELFLSNTPLVNIPIFVKRATNLKYLELAYNKITLDEPDLFVSLTKLKILHLGGNNIEFIPPTIFKPLTELEELTLNDNKMTHIPSELIAGLVKLKTLHLQNNFIDNLPQNLIGERNVLEEIDLSNNTLTRIVPYFVSRLPSLKRFYFNRNPWQCGYLNQLLVDVKARQIQYNSDDYNGHTAVCKIVRFCAYSLWLKV